MLPGMVVMIIDDRAWGRQAFLRILLMCSYPQLPVRKGLFHLGGNDATCGGLLLVANCPQCGELIDWA